jgi:hypothetical protein
MLYIYIFLVLWRPFWKWRPVEFFQCRESIQVIIIYLDMKFRWNRTMLNLCGIVAGICCTFIFFFLCYFSKYVLIQVQPDKYTSILRKGFNVKQIIDYSNSKTIGRNAATRNTYNQLMHKCQWLWNCFVEKSDSILPKYTSVLSTCACI